MTPFVKVRRLLLAMRKARSCDTLAQSGESARTYKAAKEEWLDAVREAAAFHTEIRDARRRAARKA
jgi:hypothetical protein